MDNEYKVTWEIDISADSPTEAALLALETQRDGSSVATVFKVSGPDGDYEVDLMQGTSEPVRKDLAAELNKRMAEVAEAIEEINRRKLTQPQPESRSASHTRPSTEG